MADDVPMEVEPETGITKDPIQVDDSEKNVSKRTREDGEDAEEKGEKKAKIEDEKSAEEQRIEEADKKNGVEEAEKKNGVEEAEKKNGVEEAGKESGPTTVGHKTFSSSVELFDYFFKLLHNWSPNLDLNKYEHTVLLDLLKKGHLEAERKIGKGVKAFQVRFHPQFKSRCFFLIREDESSEDFSFRKCVDHILPLPENMQIKHDVNKALRGKGGGRGGRGRGRGGKKY